VQSGQQSEEQGETPGQAAGKTSGQEGRGEPIAGLEVAVLVGCGLGCLYLLGQLVMFQYGRDQGIYAVVAETMLRGGAPYRDAWDFKPPGIFLVYAVARLLFGASEHAVRVVEALGFASIVYAFTVLSRRFVGTWRAGLAAGVICVGTHAQLEFWHTGQPESFGAVALVWAMVCATYEGQGPGFRRKQLAAWATAGALITCAALLKPPLGGGFVLSLLLVCRAEYRRAAASQAAGEGGAGEGAARAVLAPVACYAAGGAAVVLLTVLYFAAKGALGDLHQTLFVFTPYYTKLSFRADWFWGFVYLAFEQWTVGFSAFIACGLGLHLGMRALSPREHEGSAHVAALVVFQIVGVGMQAKFFPYHYGAALPFGALLAGWGFWKLWLRARSSVPAVAMIGALLYVLGDARGATRDLEDTFQTRCRLRRTALFNPSQRQEINDHLYSVADVNAGANRQVAAWLAEHTPEDAAVFVWGFEPVMYVASHRRPATRYVYNVAQRVAWATETREGLMRDLERTPPAAIVVEHRDVFPAVTGNNLDSADSLRGFPQLAALLRDGYWRVDTIEDFDLYLPRK
jgi:hypothetical protein